MNDNIKNEPENTNSLNTENPEQNTESTHTVKSAEVNEVDESKEDVVENNSIPLTEESASNITENESAEDDVTQNNLKEDNSEDEKEELSASEEEKKQDENINKQTSETSITVELKQTEEEKPEVVEVVNAENSDNEEIKKDENHSEIETDTSEDQNEEDKSEVSEEDDALEMIDYSVFSRAELVEKLEDLIENFPIQKIKDHIEIIKSSFYRKYQKEVEEKKIAFFKENEDANQEDFVVEEDELEIKLKSFLSIYRRKKGEYFEQLEKEKESNLKAKYEIIDKIKQLTQGTESLNTTFKEFRNLQEQWREIGLVPQSDIKNLWETYHHHVEKFYDFVKINKELRDLDLQNNLKIKIDYCEKAEKLILEPSVTKAFKSLQQLHDHWRETGPVPLEKKDEIWERFKEATSVINKKHHEYLENLHKEQENNLAEKVALCEKVEEYLSKNMVKPKDWDEATEEILKIQQLWRTIGFATKKENTKIYERFREDCNKFFQRKRDFFNDMKEEQENNLQIKTELCMQAEALKDSTEWRKTTEDLMAIQKKWKEIGPVPRRNSEAIWKRFRSACDQFFNNKSEHFANINEVYAENLKLKNELIEKIEKFEITENVQECLTELNKYQKEWTDIGHVPFKQKDQIQNKYREAINKKFEQLRIDDSKRNMFLYKQKVENMMNVNRDSSKIYREQERIANNIQKLESDIVVLENNIGFFAKTKNAEALIKDVNKKIEKAKENIKMQKQKLSVIRSAKNNKSDNK